ncbi:MAG: hypothetical protein BWY76_02087 [bacterium ADurb.Bin429]|nr:MAG: hypothetical protein BWY76_02087 [bacterium ADurb.Bin429]
MRVVYDNAAMRPVEYHAIPCEMYRLLAGEEINRAGILHLLFYAECQFGNRSITSAGLHRE